VAAASPGSEPRYFSYEEANRTLPLVRRIVTDIVDHHAELQPLVGRYRQLDPDDRAEPGARRLKLEIDETAELLDGLIQELQELGCLFKGFREGLVDWYSYHAGRSVFLCWKLDEPEIGFWHPIDAGFVGRQPIAPDQREAFRSTPG
jgi:hypothetical protein